MSVLTKEVLKPSVEFVNGLIAQMSEQMDLFIEDYVLNHIVPKSIDLFTFRQENRVFCWAERDGSIRLEINSKPTVVFSWHWHDGKMEPKASFIDATRSEGA